MNISAVTSHITGIRQHIFSIFTGNMDYYLLSNSSWQYFTSPNYPNNYDNGADISWQIHNQYGYYIALQVMDIQLESGYDYLHLYDGNSADYPTLASLTGSNNNGSIYYSTGSYMYVKFTSDDIITNRGFQLRYQGTYTTPGIPTTPTPGLIT